MTSRGGWAQFSWFVLSAMLLLETQPARSDEVSAQVLRRVHPVLIRNEYNPVLQVTLRTADGGAATLQKATFSLAGSSELDDIDSLQLFYTEGANFSSQVPIGEPQAAAPTVVFSASQPLGPAGSLWLSLRLRSSAALDHRVAARCLSVETSRGKVVPRDAAPQRRHRIGVALRRAGDDGVHTYRIPALTVTPAGTLLAVYDMRRRMGRDLQEDIDIGLSRSTDGGQNWEPPRVIMDQGEYGGLPQEQNGCSDPGIIVDPQTGDIFCFAVWMWGKPGKHQWVGDGSEPGFEIGKSAQLLMVRSSDDGQSWSAPENLTRGLKKPEWWLLAPAPQQGIALEDGTLVMPCQGRDESGVPFAALLISRDHGQSWHVSNPAYSGGNECQVAQLGDGSLMLNMRNGPERFRAVYVTDDLGQTWRPHATNRNTLIEPNCNASLIRVDYQGQAAAQHVLLFSNPQSQSARTHHTVQVSFDDGQTWPERHRLLLDEGRGAGYSSMARLDDRSVGIVYEGSQAHLVFEKLSLDELLAGRDPLTTYDPRLYLLLDDQWVAEQSGLQRVFNQARPLPEPIIWPENPRTETDCAWGNVIREPDGRFRLWYATMMMGDQGQGPHEMAMAGVWGKGEQFTFQPRSAADVRDVETMLGKYAESSDGLHWHKPVLHQIEFQGSRANNILLNGERAAAQTGGTLTNFDGYTILRDDQEKDPRKRYKMFAHWESVHCWDNHDASGQLGRPQEKHDAYWAARGEYLTYSADGLHWDQPLVRTEFPSGGGDRMLVMPDRREKRWIAYARSGGWAYPAFSYSQDLLNWSAPEGARHITPETVSAPAVECMIPFNYGNQDLAVVCGMDKPRGILSPRLAWRHEGQPWTWGSDPALIIPFGPPSSYYATGAVPLHNEPMIVGDQLLIFFNAFSRQQEIPSIFGTRSIGVATLRRDGFAGLTPGSPDEGGHLLTRPLTVAGRSLMLNVEHRGGPGTVLLAVFDSAGHPLPGYGWQEAHPITDDGVRLRASFAAHTDLRELEGQQVRLGLRIHGRAIVYAFAFTDM